MLALWHVPIQTGGDELSAAIDKEEISYVQFFGADAMPSAQAYEQQIDAVLKENNASDMKDVLLVGGTPKVRSLFALMEAQDGAIYVIFLEELYADGDGLEENRLYTFDEVAEITAQYEAAGGLVDDTVGIETADETTSPDDARNAVILSVICACALAAIELFRRKQNR